jgi:dethiobiotin synthetase
VYKEAVSPHLAARKEGNPVELSKVREDFEAACKRHEFVFAEGSGGIICPIRYDGDTATGIDDVAKAVPQKIFLVDIIKALNLPILVVTTAALGSINACVLTVEYARSRGINVHGLIVNRYGMSKNFEMEDDNIKMMQDLTGLPVFAKISEGDNDLGVDKTF